MQFAPDWHKTNLQKSTEKLRERRGREINSIWERDEESYHVQHNI